MVLLYLALRGLQLNLVWLALRQANYAWLVPGIVVYFIGLGVRAWRWHYLLWPIKPISTARLFPITAIGYMGNNIYPIRAGALLRGYLLRRMEAIPISASLGLLPAVLVLRRFLHDARREDRRFSFRCALLGGTSENRT